LLSEGRRLFLAGACLPGLAGSGIRGGLALLGLQPLLSRPSDTNRTRKLGYRGPLLHPARPAGQGGISGRQRDSSAKGIAGCPTLSEAPPRTHPAPPCG